CGPRAAITTGRCNARAQPGDHRYLTAAREATDPEGRPIGRRAFLGIVGVGLTSLAWGGGALDLVNKSTLLLPESLRAAVPFGQGRPLAAARALTFTSAERPYVDSLTLDQALAPDAMLAHTMDGAPLTRPHGAPLRLLMPQMYGYKGVKWLERITFSERAIDG